MTLENEFAHLYRTYFGERAHEAAEIQTLPDHLEGVTTFIDVGASLGVYTYHANKIMRGGRIIAIEADPDRFAELERNCRKWDDGSNTIEPIHAAAGDSRDPVSFYVTHSRISGGFFPVDERPAEYQAVNVSQVLLDDYPAGPSTFVKIDVEGGELRVLQGATRHIEGGSRFLSEVTWWGDRERGYSPLTFLNFARKQGLTVRKNTTRRNSSFVLGPGGPSGYLTVAPLLAAKNYWSRWVPKRLRKGVEGLLVRRRGRQFSVIP